MLKTLRIEVLASSYESFGNLRSWKDGFGSLEFEAHYFPHQSKMVSFWSL